MSSSEHAFYPVEQAHEECQRAMPKDIYTITGKRSVLDLRPRSLGLAFPAQGILGLFSLLGT